MAKARASGYLFWFMTAVLLVFLSVNELLDLQTLLTAIGRQYAVKDGWYEERRQVQYLFIVGLSGLAAVAGAFMF